MRIEYVRIKYMRIEYVGRCPTLLETPFQGYAVILTLSPLTSLTSLTSHL